MYQTGIEFSSTIGRLYEGLAAEPKAGGRLWPLSEADAAAEP